MSASQESGTVEPDGQGRLREVAGVFLRLGLIAFGGPVAHIAMMREELVRRRGWVSDERFVDLMGATNLIPGPNSTELAIHLGWDRARWRGLLLAGVCFILPAALIVTGLAWGYLRYGDTPTARWLLYGVVPAVLGIIVWALVPLSRTVLLDRERRPRVLSILIAVGVLAGYLAGVNELLLLAAGIVVGIAGWAATRARSGPAVLAPWLLLAAEPRFADPTAGQLTQLFATMLKIGAVLYGSGYVLLAFLEGDFVDRLGWVTHAQLLDAVSVGQVTPGPVFTTATFLGYLVAGPMGALLATVAIFLPSFVFVGLLTRLTDRLRSSPWMSAGLDGVNAAALALMVGVTAVLARSALVDWLTVAITVAVLVLLWRTRLNSAWYVAGGAVLGVAAGLW